MRDLPIHVRLTALYLISLTVIITLFSFASWYAMKMSMYHAIDNDLGYRIHAVAPFIRSHSLSTSNGFAKTFADSSDSSVVGVFVQITDAHSHLLYESDLLTLHHVPVLPRAVSDTSIDRSTVQHEGWTIRVATQQVMVGNTPLTVHVVEPLSDLLTSLHEITLRFVSLVSVALLVTACVGYWVSRRALAPVEQLRREADAIDPADLTARLQQPAHEDEVGGLVRTLNSMLTRIEKGFNTVERFTADASHELRAPLAFIVTAGEVCLRRQRSNEELVDGMSRILAEARRMSRLVEDLLALARGDALLAGPSQEVVDLSALLAEVVERMTPAASAKDLLLEMTLPAEPLYTSGVPSELRRVLLILIDNAIKYTDNGKVGAGLAAGDGEVRITICDTGIGIESSALPHLFARFWRADKARSRAEGGVGLGLALAAQMLQRCQGKIDVASTFGQGSSFIITLQQVDSTATVTPQRGAALHWQSSESNAAR